jgi:hypothetical protein
MFQGRPRIDMPNRTVNTLEPLPSETRVETYSLPARPISPSSSLYYPRRCYFPPLSWNVGPVKPNGHVGVQIARPVRSAFLIFLTVTRLTWYIARNFSPSNRPDDGFRSTFLSKALPNQKSDRANCATNGSLDKCHTDIYL